MALANDKQGTQVLKSALSTTMRAIAGDSELEIAFTSDRTILNGKNIRLANISHLPNKKEIAIARGQCDAIAMRLAAHDAKIHAKNAPIDADARATFDALEQARVEVFGAMRMVGMRDNLSQMLEEKYSKAGFDKITNLDDAPLSEALSLMLREKFGNISIPKSGETITELWRKKIEKKCQQSLEELGNNIENQQDFAKSTKQLLLDLELISNAEFDAENEYDEDEGEQDYNDQPSDNNQQQEEQMDGEGQESSSDEQQEEGDGEQGGEIESEFSPSDEDITSDGEISTGDDSLETDGAKLSNQPKYKIFTTEFDEIVSATELCPSEELEQLRALLDKQLETLAGTVARLANKLQRRLMAQQNRSWNYDLEEGVLDSARLTRIIIDPMQPLSFKAESDMDFRDTIVTLLIDNSGSMRGRPISIAAICADILARTLERCSVKTEILGFTTRAWKGGKSREAWLEANRPANPGRVNDIRHIIYKGAEEPYRHARKNLGLMMREGLLKENIDGEALSWAQKRLMARPENRRILVVISDGAPVDDSTQSVNSPNYLEAHLREVIKEIETNSPIQLIAIGIGHDVTRYYQHAITLQDAEELGGALTDELADLFEEKPKTGVRSRRYG
ncbi:MAG: cobaltochelatase subunit CobT [Devosiaceae bacterium]|nr:cobaltochelatase subunit CobT [Devosiaceae bacterium]